VPAPARICAVRERTTMANWNLSKRLFMGVGSLVALLLVSGGVSFITGRSMKA